MEVSPTARRGSVATMPSAESSATAVGDDSDDKRGRERRRLRSPVTWGRPSQRSSPSGPTRRDPMKPGTNTRGTVRAMAHNSPWGDCSSGDDCLTPEGADTMCCHSGDRRCMSMNTCRWARKKDKVNRNCDCIAPYVDAKHVARWGGCKYTSDCDDNPVNGQPLYCRIGDRRCLLDDDCKWANLIDKTNRDCEHVIDHCLNGLRDGDLGESDNDCGGECRKCHFRERCNKDSDCVGGKCHPIYEGRDRRCLTRNQCNWAKKKDKENRNCDCIAPYVVGKHVARWGECSFTSDCDEHPVNGQPLYCRNGDRRCLLDADCKWANLIDKTSHYMLGESDTDSSSASGKPALF
eukprot:m51a1_g11181 hypothetical protein (349) ;mRNA; f:68-2483